MGFSKRIIVFIFLGSLYQFASAADPMDANVADILRDVLNKGGTLQEASALMDQARDAAIRVSEVRKNEANAKMDVIRHEFNPAKAEHERRMEQLRHENKLKEEQEAIKTREQLQNMEVNTHVLKKKAELADPGLSAIIKEDKERKFEIQEAEAEARVKVHEADLQSSQATRLKNALEADKYKEDAKWKFFGDPKTLAKYGAAVAGVGTILLTARYGLPVFWDWIKKKLFKPRLVLETSVGKSAGDFTSSVSIDELIVPAKLKEEFAQLVKTTKEADELGLDYQHVLFYGPPGTGKTHAAKILARSSGLDYDIIAGSAFDQFSENEALKELDDIFSWARKGKKGRLVFIDEADSLLATRSPDNPRATKMVNMFLSQLPEAQDPDIMFILATNHPERLDPAIRSRISNALEFDLPEREQIEEQLALRFETEVISEGMSVDENIRDRLVVYADNMKGFSGRDILSAVVQARNAAIATDKETIDREIFDVVIERMIERKEAERLMDIQSNRGAFFTGKTARESQKARPAVNPEAEPKVESLAAPAA